MDQQKPSSSVTNQDRAVGGRAEATRRAKLQHRATFEAAETRLLLSTFTVSNTLDAGPGSFRQAIADSNADAAQANTIKFNLAGPARVITPTTPLPPVTTPTVIDGSSQPGFAGTPLVTLRGSATDTVGLNVVAGRSTVQGLTVSGFSAVGIALGNLGANTVRGNVVGEPGAGNGVGISVASDGNVIGGTTPESGNVVQDNSVGVNLEGDGNAVASNVIRGNAGPGVRVHDGQGNQVLGNAIAGNGGLGILLDGAGGGAAPNANQPSPLIVSITGTGATRTIAGYLTGRPNTAGNKVEFFANAGFGANGTVGGQTPLGALILSTDAQGNAPFSLTYSPVAGQPVVSATATDASGNTSQFSVRNPAPTVALPPVQTTNRNTPLVYSKAAGNALTVRNLGIGASAVAINLSATTGTLKMATVAGLTGSGDGTGSLAYSGPVDAVNAALDGLKYTPAADVSGPATLSLFANNLAGDEQGGARTTAGTSAVVVRSVDGPVVTPAKTTVNVPTSSGLVVTPSPTGPVGVVGFGVTGISGGRLVLADGTTAVPSGSFLTLAQGASGLKFVPAIDFQGTAGFTVRDTTTGDASGLIGLPTSASIVVGKATTATTLTADADGTTVGQPVTFRVSVNSTTGTGTVVLSQGGLTVGTIALDKGTGSLTTSALAVGPHAITATYPGDPANLPSTSSVLNQSVKAVTTATTLSSSSPNTTLGQPVTLTATVGPATATGTVTLTEGSTTIGTFGIAKGTGSLTTSTLSVGSHAITATYSGDAENAPSTSTPLTQGVGAMPTTTKVVSSDSEIDPGESVTFTASVAPVAAGGAVTFFDGTTALGSGALSGGSATFRANTLSPGAHVIAATYAGDGTHAPSTSTSLAQTVKSPGETASTTTLTASANPSEAGRPITLTAVVASPDTKAAPTGEVRFLDGTKPLGMVALSGGKATLTTSTLAPGAHDLRATYLGKDGVAASISVAIAQVVAKEATSVAIEGTPATTAPGAPVLLKATVRAGSGAGTPTGSVVFSAGALVLGMGVPAEAGGFVLTTTSLPAGATSSVVATFLGDATFATSQSSPVSLTVEAPPVVVVRPGQAPAPVVPPSTPVVPPTTPVPTPSPTPKPKPTATIPPTAVVHNPNATTTVLTAHLVKRRRKQAVVELRASVLTGDGKSVVGESVRIVGTRGKGRILPLVNGVAKFRLNAPLPTFLSASAFYIGGGGKLASQASLTPVLPGNLPPVTRA